MTIIRSHIIETMNVWENYTMLKHVKALQEIREVGAPLENNAVTMWKSSIEGTPSQVIIRNFAAWRERKKEEE